MSRKQLLVGLVVAAVISWGTSAPAVVVNNPSFETDTFTVWPGYISGNGPITGWTENSGTKVGLNPAGGSPFADNGAVPDGTNVAFVQGQNNTLSQTITGLVSGETYRVSYRYNDRNGTQARLKVTLGGTVLQEIPNNFTQVGGTNPYYYGGYEFTASSASDTLTFQNLAVGDSTVLVDQIFITAAGSDGLTTARWTGDGDAGVSSAWNYTAAANFGSTDGLAISGVTFAGTTNGGNPTGTGFTTTGLTARFANDANSLTIAGGGSATLARDFNYNGGTVTFTGLTPGRRYASTLYTVGFDDTGRKQIFSDGSGAQVTIDQDVHGNNNGLRLTYTYTADAASKTFSFSQIGIGSLHVYGVSNRQNFLAWDVAGPADWHTGSNWDAEDNATAPSAGVDAVIDNGGTATLAGGTATAASLQIGGTTGGTLVHTGGTLDVPIIKLGSGGTLQANSLGGNTGASGFTFDGGTLKTTASFTTTVPMTLNAGGGTVDTNGFNPKLNGMIDGSGALTKTGAGTMELTGTNTYSGGTTVLQGGLRPRSAGAMGSGTVSIADGANFMPWFNSGSSIITNDFVLNGLGSVDGKDAIYADGGGAGFGEYTISGQITLNATSNIGGHVTNHLKLTGEVTGPGGLTKGGTWGGGTNILTLAAHNTYAGPTTITQGTLKLGDAGAVVANAGFETPAINWSYDPAGAVWAFASAGIASNGSPWFIPDAPEGNQGGFVQKTGNLSQDVNFAQAGSYSLLFSSVGRGGGNGPNDMQVQIDGTELLSWTPAQAAWTTYLSGPINLTAGNHTLNFAGQISASDKSSVVDLVRIVHDRIPDGSAVSISAGATLDLNNTAEMIGPLSGAGGSSVTLGSGALIVNSTANSTFSGAISGTGELYKTGPAQLLLNGASTYSGGTTVADGIVRIDNGQALGTGAVSVADGASLMFWASSAMTVENDIVLGGMGPGAGRPALNQDGGAGLVTINGNVLLAATSDIGVGGSSWNDMRINGIVSGPGGMVVKEENNTGAQKRTLFLSGANTYTGATDITSGTLNIQHNNALGAGGHTTGTMTWIRNGAALELQGDITTNEHAHFQGAGPSGGGAIRNISGTNTMTDSYAMDANSTIGVDAGTLVFQTTRPEGSLYDAPSGTYQLTKVGAGTLQFNGPNTYSGITYINEGTINIRNNTSLGSGGHTSGTMTWIRDGAALELQGGITINEHAHFQGSGPAGLGSIRSISGNNTMTDRYAMDADSTIGVDAGMLSLQNAGTATEGPVYEFGGSWHLTKVGAGQLRINGPSTYTGGTTIEAGIVRMDHGQALGTGAVSVADGASLMVWAPAAMTVANDITLNGMGISDTRPALNQDGGGGLVTLTGTVTLAATSDVGLGGSTSNDLVINGQITGPGGLVVDQASSGSGWSRQQTLILNANNDYSGGTNVTGGALRLGHANAAGPGDINIAGGANVLLWFNSGSNTVANNFTLGGMGSVAGGKDAIYADGGGAGYGEYVLSGQITLAADSNIGGHNINDLRITGKVTGSGGLTKGGGRTDENNTLFLANTGNDYTGATVVNAGTLLVNGSLLNTAGTTVTGGMLAGNGTIANNVDVLAGGTISAGDALGKLSIGGSYTSGGTMLAELGGTSPGVDYDWLAVTAIADLGGMVDVNLVDGFVPVSGDFFDVLTADGGIDGGVSDGLTGVTFDFADAPLPLTGQYWNTSIVGADGGPQALRLEVAAPEPSTVILAVLGLLGLTFAGWRKRKK